MYGVLRVVLDLWSVSDLPALQAGGHRFDPDWLYSTIGPDGYDPDGEMHGWSVGTGRQNAPTVVTWLSTFSVPNLSDFAAMLRPGGETDGANPVRTG